MLVTKDDKGNTIYHFKPLSEILKNNSAVNFAGGGGGNVLFLAPNASLSSSKLTFLRDNACIFIANSLFATTNVSVNNDNACYIGNKNYFNDGGRHTIILGERKNLIIGDDCLFSHSIWFRTNDPHLLYQSETNARINEPKSILIGDHCWVGQEVGFMKGAFLASGSVLGAKSFTSKACFSNASYGSNPAKLLKKGIFWTRPCTHAYTKAQSEAVAHHGGDEFKFAFEKDKFLPLKLIDEALAKCENGEQRCEFLYDFIYNNTNKNRFALFEDADTNECVLYKDSTKMSFGELIGQLKA